MLIYKIFREPEWDSLRADGRTAGAAIDLVDGYIHFSTAAQVLQTAARHFADAADLVLVAIDADGLGPELRWEPARQGALFPHLYRDLSLHEVLWAKPFPLGDAGHVLPAGVE